MVAAARSATRFETWRIDGDRSTLSFSMRRALIGELRGQFDCWGGVVLVDDSDLRRSSVRVWIDLSSLETGSAKQDDQILSTSLFDAHWEPGATFDGDAVTMVDRRHGVVAGQLSLRGANHDVVVLVEAVPTRSSPSGARSLRWRAKVSLDRRSFGLHRRRDIGDWFDDAVLSNTIEVTADIEAVLEGTSAAKPDRKPRDLTPLQLVRASNRP